MLATLPNLGPKSSEMLLRAGIVGIEQLRELGAARAYALVKRHDSRASLNLLWALEGALSGRSWQEVARHDRLSLLVQVEEIENGKQGI